MMNGDTKYCISVVSATPSTGSLYGLDKSPKLPVFVWNESDEIMDEH
jgi:hypothetical protein